MPCVKQHVFLVDPLGATKDLSYFQTFHVFDHQKVASTGEKGPFPGTQVSKLPNLPKGHCDRGPILRLGGVPKDQSYQGTLYEDQSFHCVSSVRRVVLARSSLGKLSMRRVDV